MEDTPENEPEVKAFDPKESTDAVLEQGFSYLAHELRERARSGKITAAEAKVLLELNKHRGISDASDADGEDDQSDRPKPTPLKTPFDSLEQEEAS